MRRLIFYTLAAILAALIIARSLLPEPAEQAMATVPAGYGYNLLDADLTTVQQTAGSAMVGEMNRYYMFRVPTAKSALTGVLRGKNLILICADEWAPDPSDKRECPALHRLWREGAKLTRVYRPDWYQGSDGQEFALLTGLIPTSVNDETALAWIGEQSIFLPFTLARCLGDSGYRTLAYLPDPERGDAYAALGFGEIFSHDGGALAMTSGALSVCAADSEPFFVFLRWEGGGSEALTLLYDTLKDRELLDGTALCLLTAGAEEQRAQLFLWGGGLEDAGSAAPCSELDVTPPLLNLFGADYDSRFLSGLDVFAGGGTPGTASSLTPLVTLYGSAFSDWITDAGRYSAAESAFWPAVSGFETVDEVTDYVRGVCALQYDRYVFSRRIMENNYFQLVFGE